MKNDENHYLFMRETILDVEGDPLIVEGVVDTLYLEDPDPDVDGSLYALNAEQVTQLRDLCNRFLEYQKNICPECGDTNLRPGHTPGCSRRNLS